MSTQRAWGVTWIGHAVCEFSKWKVLYLMRPQGETSLSRRQTCFSKVQSVQSVTKFGTNPSALAPLIRADQALPQRSRQKPKSFWVSPGSAEQALPVICCLYISFIRFLLCKGNSLWFRRIDNHQILPILNHHATCLFLTLFGAFQVASSRQAISGSQTKQYIAIPMGSMRQNEPGTSGHHPNPSCRPCSSIHIFSPNHFCFKGRGKIRVRSEPVRPHKDSCGSCSL